MESGGYLGGGCQAAPAQTGSLGSEVAGDA